MEPIPMNTLDHNAVTELRSSVVVDHSKLNALKTEEIAGLMDSVYGTSKAVVFVGNSALFFTPKSLVELLKNDDNRWMLVSEQLGIEVSPAEHAYIKCAVEVIARIKREAEGIKPAYPFANVPAGWTVGANIKVVGSSVKRVGHDNSYSIGLMTLQRLWKRVSPYWAGHVAHIEGVPVTAGGYGRTAVTNKNGVDVGCQNIRRYELEQFAVSQGWDFPQG